MVAEGVLLSGPSVFGGLISPARFRVVRYLKGGGPRVMSVRTRQRQVATGGLSLGNGILGYEMGGGNASPYLAKIPRAGESYRIFARTGGHRGRRQLGHLLDPCTGDDQRISIRSVLGAVPDTLVRRGRGRLLWSARLFRGSDGLRCLRLVARASPYDAPHGGCGDLRRRRSTLVATDIAGDNRGSRIAVALAGKGLRGFTAAPLAGGPRVETSARGGVALALLPGNVDRSDIAIVARYRDGSTRTFGGRQRRARVEDPLGGDPWVVEHERAHPHTPSRGACVLVWLAERRGRSGECGNTRGRAPFFFAIRRNTQYPDAPHVRGKRVVLHHTAVFGAISQRVKDVSVTGPRGDRRPAISRRGRSFIALFGGHLSASRLKLRFVLKDGRTLSYTGRRQLNLAPPQRP